jgi:hypothetical protein
MAYAYAANTYEQMSKVYDPLEIGVDVLASKEFKKNVEPCIIKELHSMGFPKNRKNATTKSII